jgi:CPA2 family monovalent cation:H+ antiporter-2
VTVSPGAWAAGRTLGELDLRPLQVEVTAVRRRKERQLQPTADVRLDVGDVVVLRGLEDGLALAEARLLQG